MTTVLTAHNISMVENLLEKISVYFFLSSLFLMAQEVASMENLLEKLGGGVYLPTLVTKLDSGFDSTQLAWMTKVPMTVCVRIPMKTWDVKFLVHSI